MSSINGAQQRHYNIVERQCFFHAYYRPCSYVRIYFIMWSSWWGNTKSAPCLIPNTVSQVCCKWGAYVYSYLVVLAIFLLLWCDWLFKVIISWDAYYHLFKIVHLLWLLTNFYCLSSIIFILLYLVLYIFKHIINIDNLYNKADIYFSCWFNIKISYT